MKTTLLTLVMAIAIGLVSFIVGQATVDRGIDRETVSNLLRTAGDSAVTEFRSGSGMKDFVAELLADTVKFYDAEVRAATKIVIRRDTIRIQGERIIVNRPVNTVSSDTLLVVLPPIDTNGVSVVESLLIQPPPNLLERSVLISFDPDTIIAALLRTSNGIDRFAAAGLTRGVTVTVSDAAQIRIREHRGLKKAFQITTIASCVLFGFSMNSSASTALIAVSGGLCVGSGGIQLLAF